MSDPKPNTSQQGHGKCPYCKGTGKVRVPMSTGSEAAKDFPCPKCNGKGDTAKIDTK